MMGRSLGHLLISARVLALHGGIHGSGGRRLRGDSKKQDRIAAGCSSSLFIKMAYQHLLLLEPPGPIAARDRKTT